MKRIHLTTVCALLMAITAMAQGNRIIIEDFEISPDSTLTVPVILANADTTRGVQFNLTMPEGLQIKNMQASSYSRSLGMSISRNYQNGVHIVLLHASNRVGYPPDSAVIANMKVVADPDFKGGQIFVWKVIGSTMDNVTFSIDGDTTNVTVPSSSLIVIPIDQRPQQEHYFNLNGQPIASPDSASVAIEVTTLPNGQRSSRKLAVR